MSLPLPTTPFGWDISTPHWLYYEAWAIGGNPLPRRLAARPRPDRPRLALDPGRRGRGRLVGCQRREVQDARVRRLLGFRRRRGRAVRDPGVVHQPRHVPASALDPPARERRARRPGSLLGGIFGALLLDFCRSIPSATRPQFQLFEAGAVRRVRPRADPDGVERPAASPGASAGCPTSQNCACEKGAAGRLAWQGGVDEEEILAARRGGVVRRPW